MLRFSFSCLRPQMRTSFHHQPEAQQPSFQLSTSWRADYPIFRREAKVDRGRIQTKRPCAEIHLAQGRFSWSRACPASIRLYVGVLNHLFPHAELNLNESSQFLRCAGKSLEAHVLEPRLDVRAVDDFA